MKKDLWYDSWSDTDQSDGLMALSETETKFVGGAKHLVCYKPPRCRPCPVGEFCKRMCIPEKPRCKPGSHRK